MTTYIIDALNVIHKNPNMRQLLTKSKENAVSALCCEISGYLRRYNSYKAIIVIDGTIGALNKFHKNISLIESQNNTADNKIKEIISESTKKTFLNCVSSDTEVYNFAKMNTVTVITSENFLKLITNVNTTSVSAGKISTSITSKSKPNSSSKKEIEELKNLFGNTDDLDMDWR